MDIRYVLDGLFYIRGRILDKIEFLFIYFLFREGDRYVGRLV